ncbi:hypothetical protein A5741_01420 [Mycolicibacterium conceptionense]|uniref:hypothetical protein n=1 Tax=Mycolicibacterium conceptionense TaxID=451644 RepID=UPI00096F195B|nr:hypothetical protein [Mycolicibacterium conceptionense]OMB88859.1 hypothetical protein A5741_01420 [Mycolicibacterium conceptionense]
MEQHLLKINNIDKALACKVDDSVHPDRFLDADTDAEEVDAATAEADEPELTEDEPEVVGRHPVPRTVRTTVTHPLALAVMNELPETIPPGLTWGTTTGNVLPEAHAVGEALREQRRQDRPPMQPQPARYWGIHEYESFDYDETVRKIHAREETDYYDYLAVMKIASKGIGSTPVVAVDEWREVPGYPGYLLHSRTRELWRAAREAVLPNGNVRRYPAKLLAAKNGSYSLTVNGKTSSRGVNSLWKDTFPEFVKKSRKRKAGEWDDTVTLREEKLERTEGVAEWLEGDGASIVTRPE